MCKWVNHGTSQNLKILSQCKDVNSILSVQMCILLWFCLSKCKSLKRFNLVSRVSFSSPDYSGSTGLAWRGFTQPNMSFCFLPVPDHNRDNYIYIDWIPQQRAIVKLYQSWKILLHCLIDLVASCLMKLKEFFFWNFLFFYHTSAIMFKVCLWVYSFSFKIKC